VSWFIKAITTGVVTFAATNIDDIFVLTLFFGQVGKRLQKWHVVSGQYLGIFALVAISLVGYFARLIVPHEWIGLLGLLPIAIGVKKLVDWRRVGAEKEVSTPQSSSASVFTVAAVTVANGGDNIGVYAPLFGASDFRQLVVVLIVFFILVAVWCVIGYYVGSNRLVAELLERYGHFIVPFILIGLGLYIMLQSGVFHLVGAFRMAG
jgi:cadmium resistance transport/sequestration family protein